MKVLGPALLVPERPSSGTSLSLRWVKQCHPAQPSHLADCFKLLKQLQMQNCLSQELLGQFAPEIELKFNSKKDLTAFRRKVFSMQIVLIKTSSAVFRGCTSLSDNWIALIPEDPHFVPAEAKQLLARDRFKALAPDADEIEIKLSDKIGFFDCGVNFERVNCPSCNAEIPVAWWQERMDDDFQDDEFTLHPYVVPCCKSKITLHALNYEWPQGFGRFAIDAMNPNLGKLSSDQIAEFESILGTPLRVIYQHI